MKTTCFLGRYISGAGTPYVVVNAFEDENFLNGEIFITFEKYDGKIIRIGRKIKMPKGIYSNLQDFISRYIMAQVDSIIFYEILVQKIFTPENRNIPNVQIDLTTWDKMSWLSIVNHKFSSELLWVENNSSSEELNQSIKLVKSIEITSIDF